MVEVRLVCPSSASDCDSSMREFRKVHSALDSQDADAGLLAIGRILAGCGKCPHARADKIRLLMSAERYDEASVELDETLQEKTDRDYEFLWLRGHLDAARGKTRGAIKWWRRSLKKNPESHEVNCDMAATLVSLDRLAEALPFVRQAQRTDPDEIVANVNALYVLREQGLSGELSRLLQHAETLESDSALFWNQVARGHAFLDHPRRSLKWARRAMNCDEGMVPGLCIAADMEIALGYTKQAEASLIRLKELDFEHHGKRALLSLAKLKSSMRPRSAKKAGLDFAVEAKHLFPNDEEVERTYELVAGRLLGLIDVAEERSDQMVKLYESLHQERDALKEIVDEIKPDEPGVSLALALSQNEGQEIEFIERFPIQTHELAKEIAAFSTSNDGCIFLGVDDNGKVVGLPGVDSVRGRDKLISRVAGIASGSVKPAAHVMVFFREKDGKSVAKIHVSRGAEPLYYSNERAYVRSLDQSRPATPEEVIRLIEAHRNRNGSN